MPVYALVDDGDNILRQQTFDAHPPDPVGKGWVWLEKIEGEAPSFDPNAEHLVAAYQVDRQARTITRVKSAQVLSEDAIAERLSERKVELATAIDIIWEEKTYAGFTYDFGGEIGRRTLQTRMEDQARWLALKDACNDAIMAGMGDQESFIQLRPADNVNLTLTYNQIAGALRAMRVQQAEILSYSWAMKDEVAAASDHVALDAINVNSGWPA